MIQLAVEIGSKIRFLSIQKSGNRRDMLQVDTLHAGKQNNKHQPNGGDTGSRNSHGMPAGGREGTFSSLVEPGCGELTNGPRQRWYQDT